MLEVAHERAVRRIVDDVVRRPRGSLFLAVGRSAGVRAAIEAELAARVPELAHVSVTLRGDEGPWWRIFKERDRTGRPDGEVLLSVAGLDGMADDKRALILAHLNLGREERVIHRLHMILWVGGLSGLDGFRTGAPDLWGHRSGVELFLSSEDFEVAPGDLGPGPTPTDMEARLRQAEEDLALSPRPARRIRLLVDKALCLHELGHTDDALRAVEDAERLVEGGGLSRLEQANARVDVALRKVDLLRFAGRTEEAMRVAASTEPGPEGDPDLRYVMKAELAELHQNAGRVQESLTCSAEALDLAPKMRRQVPGGRGALFAYRASTLVGMGALDAAKLDLAAASEEVERLRARSEADNNVWGAALETADRALAVVARERGDTPRALAHVHRALTRALGLASVVRAGEGLEVVVDVYRRLGLFGDARLLARKAIQLWKDSPGEVAQWTRWLGYRDENEQRIAAAITHYESALSLYLAVAGAERGPHRRAIWLREAASVHYADLAPLVDAETADRHFESARELLGRTESAADEAASPQEHAVTRTWFAALAEARKQWDQAETYLLAFLSWAEANWGPYKRAEVLIDLARVARERGDLPRAAGYAERARREVDLDPPEYRNRFTAIAAARELARIRNARGDLAGAHAALGGAIAVAQGDGLRLSEREVLVDLADLPPLEGADHRIEYAQRARTIAQDAAFPVDEAEATLVLAGLYLQAGQARRAQALFDQVAWIVDRIGTKAVRERASRLLGELGG